MREREREREGGEGERLREGERELERERDPFRINFSHARDTNNSARDLCASSARVKDTSVWIKYKLQVIPSYVNRPFALCLVKHSQQFGESVSPSDLLV